MAQQLHFNILTFSWPKKAVPFYFHREEPKQHSRLHRNVFPNAIDSIFPGLNSSDQKFIGCTYDGKMDGFTALSIDFKTENPDLIKQYYNRKIKYIFQKKLNQIVKTNFIKETQVWVPTISKSPEQYKMYDRFTVKVQLATVSVYPELVISYDGQSKVWNQPIAELIQEISPTKFKRVLFGNEIKKFDDLAKIKDADYSNCFAVLGKDLKAELNIPFDTPARGNRYKSYLGKVENFISSFFNSKDFKEAFPLHSNEFLKVDQLRTNKTTENSNMLCFGKNESGVVHLNAVPYSGIVNGGPYDKPPYNKVHLFFITHADDKDLAKKLNGYFNQGYKSFKGLHAFARILFHTEPNFSIVFYNKENPVAEIEEILLNKRNIDRDLQYIAIYITPFSKFENDDSKREIYYKVKEMLLKRGITSQCIDSNKDGVVEYQYSLSNVAIAILAKLKGTPWRLNTPKKNELIVGIGAFKHSDVQYIGSSFSFDNTGHFNNFEYFMKSEVEILAGSIMRSVREYASVNNKPDKLIIHFYKTMSDKELEPIERGLNQLGLDIPVFIVTINKTESQDIIAFDKSWPELLPLSGTYINIGSNKYLLCNNTRYSLSGQYKASDGYPFPIKLKIDCNKPKELEQTQVVKDLIDQVYQFSRMYWKSVRQQNLPVTIKYPEMVAQIAPHFDGDEIPQFGKDNLWFL
jgi:hypothetical protein